MTVAAEKQQASEWTESAFANYRQELHQFLVRRLPTPDDANDVLQEIFLRLLRLNRTDFVRNAQAYLYGIASHVVREFHSRARTERVTYDSPMLDEQAEHPSHIQPDPLADGLSVNRQIAAALEQLPPMQLRVLLAEVRDGLSHEEIARKFGLHRDTVRQYSSRALGFIRSCWNQADSQE